MAAQQNYARFRRDSALIPHKTDKHLYNDIFRRSCLSSDISSETTDQSILPFLEAEVRISALRLDDTLNVRMTCAHTELERHRFTQWPEAY